MQPAVWTPGWPVATPSGPPPYSCNSPRQRAAWDSPSLARPRHLFSNGFPHSLQWCERPSKWWSRGSLAWSSGMGISYWTSGDAHCSSPFIGSGKPTVRPRRLSGGTRFQGRPCHAARPAEQYLVSTNKNLKMKIDGATLVVTILITALFALPFVWDRSRRIRGRARMLRSLQSLAQEHQCQVHHHGICAGMALALDEERKFLFHIGKREGVAYPGYLNLAEVRSCRAVRTERNAKGTHADARLERVELSLVPKDSERSATRLVLFDGGSGNLLDGEEQFADKWTELIQRQLKSNTD